MADNTIKEFLVALGFKIDEAGLKRFVGGISSASLRIMAFGTTMVAASAVIVNSIDNIAKEAEQLDLLAKRFNTTASEMDDFGDAAEIMGIGQDKAFESLTALSRVVGQAALGIGRGKVILEKLGIEAKDASGHVRATTDVMADLQVKLSKMDRGQGIAIMEKLGLDPALLRMFNGELGDTSKISKALSEIDASVGFDFDKNIAESKAYMTQQREMMVNVRLLKMWMDKLWERVATDLMPKVRQGMKNVSMAFKSFRKMLESDGKKIVGSIEPIIETIMNIGTGFLTLVGRLATIAGKLLGTIIGLFNRLNDATNGWIGWIGAALIAWKAFNLGFLATPLGAILGVGVAILALYDDFMVWKEGGDSLIDWTKWAPGVESLLSGIDTIIGALGYLVDGIGNVFGAFGMLFSGNISGFFDGITDAAISLFTGIQEIGFAVLELASGIGSLLVEFGKMIGIDLSGFVAMFSSVFGFIGDLIKGVVDTINTMLDVAGKVGDVFGKITSGIGGSLGALGDIAFGGSASLAPSPSTQNNLTNNRSNVAQQTTINVSGSSSPQATAQAVAGQQGTVNANMARNMRTGAR
jgi:hypothetical protein